MARPDAPAVNTYIAQFSKLFPELKSQLLWEVLPALAQVTEHRLRGLSSDYRISGTIGIHKSAHVEEHVTLKGPVIISANAFVGAHAYLRQGVFLDEHVRIGPGCEIKSTFIFSASALAHFNFVGDSLLGSSINLEAGAILANYHNDRANKLIDVLYEGNRIPTGLKKFGALVGDRSKIGANAVLSPGTLLPPDSLVRRLELVEQLKSAVERP